MDEPAGNPRPDEGQSGLLKPGDRLRQFGDPRCRLSLLDQAMSPRRMSHGRVERAWRECQCFVAEAYAGLRVPAVDVSPARSPESDDFESAVIDRLAIRQCSTAVIEAPFPVTTAVRGKIGVP